MLRQLVLACACIASHGYAAFAGSTDLGDVAAELSRRGTDPQLAADAMALSRAATLGEQRAVEAAYQRLRADVSRVQPTQPDQATLWRAIRRTHELEMAQVAVAD